VSDEPKVPGEFKCPKCGFVIMKSVLYAESGNIARDTRDTLEPCPNDGEILRPVTFFDALNEARGEACRVAKLVRIGEQMETLLQNLTVRGRLAGHEEIAAKNICSIWAQAQAQTS
jgi:hypothetical protein